VKIAIVTGAGRGIGAAIAARLEQEGYQVFPFNRADGWDVKNQLNIRQFLADFETLDLLVNNAGICIVKPFELFSFDDWDNTIDTKPHRCI
jgi:3-oxoacyl-[acyl-carrier protein] reductase